MEIATRPEQLKKLQSRSFDLVVVGGGATGTGVALDAALRGLRVALVEAFDFGSGTSSHSTKLIHGGVRYLERAVKRFDWRQLALVGENLKERQTLLRLAPHLTTTLPILIPIYRWIDLFYYLPGLKLYDWLAKKRSLGKSHFISAEAVMQAFPHIRKLALKGGVLFYDGQFDDARMNLALAMTAATHGATVANYVACIGLLKEGGKLSGIVAKEQFSGQEWEVRAKVVVNATGPFADQLRQMDNPSVKPKLQPSGGSHLLLDGSWTAGKVGLLIPKTADGRVLFVLPWEGETLVGTTEVSVENSEVIQPTEEEIDYLLNHFSYQFDRPLVKSDVKAAWKGIRPLLGQLGVTATAKLSREHQIEVSASGLYSLMGGKWSSYRKMAQELVDQLPFSCGSCQTEEVQLIGSEGYHPNLSSELVEKYGLPLDIADHLARAYGGRAGVVAEMGKTKRLVEGFPFIEAEVFYAMRYEYACSPEDILQRRTQLGRLDRSAEAAARPVVQRLMAS